MLQEDIKKLQGFLLNLKTTTFEIIEDPVLIGKEFLNLQSRAMSEWIRASERIIRTHNELPKSADDPKLNSRLTEVGLSGETLAFKLDAISVAKEFFYSLRDAARRAGGAALVRLRRAGRRLLDLMDVVLGSLARIFPRLEAVSEVKDTIAGMIAES